MRILLDASAIAKRYKQEQGRETVERLLRSADSVVLAAHCRVEVSSSLCREVHDRSIDLLQYGRVMAEVAEDFTDFEVRALSADVEALAIAAMERHRLRVMDALHIGTAQSARVDLFVTADRRQAEAAQTMGLKTELIEA